VLPGVPAGEHVKPLRRAPSVEIPGRCPMRKRIDRPHGCHCCGGSGEMRRGMRCPLCAGTGWCGSCHQTLASP